MQILSAVGCLIRSGEERALEALTIRAERGVGGEEEEQGQEFEGNQFHLIYGICFEVMASQFSIPTEKLATIVQVLCSIFDQRLFPSGEFLDKVITFLRR